MKNILDELNDGAIKGINLIDKLLSMDKDSVEDSVEESDDLTLSKDEINITMD